MNALCRYNLCVLQKEAWLPGGAAPWAQLGFLERGNPVQPSQTCSTCSESWDLLVADASPLWGRNPHDAVWECAHSHCGEAGAVLRIVSSVGLRQ